MATETTSRKKSPRAPSLSLDDAIERVARIYKQEGRNAAPVEVIAKHLGYNGAKNGAALSTLASLRYFGLMDRPAEGQMAVSKDFESYQWAPEEALKRSFLTQWLKTPAVFAQLLEKYAERLPSDGVLVYELIQNGFSPASAEACVNVFRRSVESAGYYDILVRGQVDPIDTPVSQDDGGVAQDQSERPPIVREHLQPAPLARPQDAAPMDGYDRIPVRLTQGRKAYIEVPNPFYQADKVRLTAQISLLLADDEESSDE